MAIDKILSDFTKKIPKNDTKTKNKHAPCKTLLSSFPLCHIRTGKMRDGKLMLCCGNRDMIHPDNAEEVYSLALDECSKCGGFTTPMIKNVEFTYLRKV